MASSATTTRSLHHFVGGPSPPAHHRFTTLCTFALKDCDSSLLEVQAVPRHHREVQAAAQPPPSKGFVEGSGNTAAAGFASDSKLHESTYREKIHQEVVRVLLECPPSLKRATLPDGSVPGVALFKASQTLRSLCFNSLACLFRAGQGRNTSWQFWSQVDINPMQRTVRLRALPEQLLLLAEACFHRAAADRGISPSRLTLPLADIAGHPDVQRCLQRLQEVHQRPYHLRFLPTGVGVAGADAVPFLRSVLEGAETLVCKQIQDAEYVTLQSPAHLICHCIRELLLTWKAGVILAREGEVSLSWVAEQPQVQATLGRTGLPCSGEAALRALRDAILQESSGLELEGAGTRASIRLADQNGKLLLTPSGFSNSALSCRRVLFASTGNEKLQQAEQDTQRGATADNRQKNLRGLLGFYFQPFNLQHNRLLMSLVKQQHLREGSKGLPVPALRFTLAELEALPRIRRWVDRWLGHKGAAARRAVLAAVLQLDDGDSEGDMDEGLSGLPFPVRLLENADGEVLELTYEPQLRLCVEVPAPVPAASQEAGQPLRPEPPPLPREQLEQLLPDVAAPASAPQHGRRRTSGAAARVVTVVSYSVSSDLSHGQSPKAAPLLDAALDGRLDPEAVSWEARLKQLGRELRHYDADVVCLQGLQSIGERTRCSEKDVAWFSLQEEPAANHLVHLYRVLSKANYGVAFSPTLLLPGSKTISLGNAVFWKRSRWQLLRHGAASSHAVEVLLQSRGSGWQVLVCSMKAIINYAREWGGDATEEELLSPLGEVAARLRFSEASGAAAAAAAPAARIWCMDAGCPVEAVHSALGMAPPGHAAEGKSSWSNSHASPGLPPSFWQAPASGGATAEDFILHDGSLRPWAVLGPRTSGADPVRFFEDGFPSDHLLLMAVFVASGEGREEGQGAADADGHESAGSTEPACPTGSTATPPMQPTALDWRSDTHPSPSSSRSAQSCKAAVSLWKNPRDPSDQFKNPRTEAAIGDPHR